MTYMTVEIQSTSCCLFWMIVYCNNDVNDEHHHVTLGRRCTYIYEGVMMLFCCCVCVHNDQIGTFIAAGIYIVASDKQRNKRKRQKPLLVQEIWKA